MLKQRSRLADQEQARYRSHLRAPPPAPSSLSGRYTSPSTVLSATLTLLSQSLADNGINLSNDAVCHPPSHITAVWMTDSLGAAERQCPGSMEDRLRD